MNILDFLTNNAVLVIIIIGVLSSLFSGSRKRARDARRTRNRMPSFGGDSPFADQSNDGPITQPAVRYEDTFPEVDDAPESQRMEERIEHWGQDTGRYHEDMQIRNASPIRMQTVMQDAIGMPEYKGDAKTRKSSLHPSDTSDVRMEGLDPAHAMQGMMWAEVFGPPKSKRPHFSLRRR